MSAVPLDHRGPGTGVSLVVCTRDRAGSLEGLLASVGAAARPAWFELVVVDNGSRDRTPEVLASYAARADHAVTVVHEPRPGLGRARNAGVAAAGGGIIAFTDDDCRLERTHLVSLAEAFAEHPIDLCGGRILPASPHDGPVALNPAPGFRYFPPRRPVVTGQVQGANMAVRRAVLLELGGFDERLGAGTHFRCEDIDLCARALAAGHRAAHVPGIVVWHAHGRRGAELRALERDNERATGAFVAKRVLDGERAYARAWAAAAVRSAGRRPVNVVRSTRSRLTELSGAAAYVAARRRGLA
ncbi:MAG: glycosyltransferase [Actinomycetota bacterium]|nr:glycosyltransferase [Actinomycetota bacterium]